MEKSKKILGTLMVLMLMICACKKESTNPQDNKPVACFTASRDTILLWDTIQLNATCSKGATSYAWESTGWGNLSTTSGDKSVFRPDGGNMVERGDVEIKLAVTNSKGVDNLTKKMFIREPRPIDYEANYACFDSCESGAQTRFPDYTLAITASGSNSITLTGLEASPVTADMESWCSFQIKSGSYQSATGGMDFDPTNSPKITLYILYSSPNHCRAYCVRQ